MSDMTYFGDLMNRRSNGIPIPRRFCNILVEAGPFSICRETTRMSAKWDLASHFFLLNDLKPAGP